MGVRDWTCGCFVLADDIYYVCRVDATQTIKHLVYMLKDVVPEETAQAKLFGNEVKGSDSAWVDYLKDAANLLPPVSTAADLQQLSAGLGICGAFSAVVCVSEVSIAMSLPLIA
jgi:hypothetical protein